MFEEAQFKSGKFTINQSPRMIHKLIFTLSELTKFMGDDVPMSVLARNISTKKPEEDAELLAEQAAHLAKCTHKHFDELEYVPLQTEEDHMVHSHPHEHEHDDEHAHEHDHHHDHDHEHEHEIGDYHYH